MPFPLFFLDTNQFLNINVIEGQVSKLLSSKKVSIFRYNLTFIFDIRWIVFYYHQQGGFDGEKNIRCIL